ncbi:MAG: hypothetical protein RLZZ385_2756 [Pseudomonadota bacterium]|jgi:hypothetical protein
MSEENSPDNNLKDLQSAALTASATVIVFFVVYWAIQFSSAYSLLSMAYDW